MTQFDLFGGAKPTKPAPLPRGDDRLLFALYPDDDTVARIQRANAALRARQGLSGRPRPASLLHVTLRHVADTVGPPPAVVETLVAAADGLRFAPFEVRLDEAMRFVGSRAFVLLAREAPNTALIEFQRALCAQLDQAGAGWRVGGAGFTPHLTLSYEERGEAEPIEPIVWTVREFVLVHSLVGQTRHLSLARFPLREL